MNATQAKYLEVATRYNAMRDQLFALDRDWTDAEANDYANTRRECEDAENLLIEWALNQVRNQPQFAIVSDLNVRTKNNVTMRKRLVSLCLSLNS